MVVCVILMTEMVMGGDSYEQRFWKWSGMLSGTTDWAWDGDPRGDPRGDPYIANDPAKYSLLRAP